MNFMEILAYMDIANMIQLVGGILAMSIPFLFLALIIIFVASLKRIARAQEEAAKAQIEFGKQLANIAIELRYLSGDGKH